MPILTTTVGSYPVPDWLAALPSEQAVSDATRVVFDLQRQAGIDLPTDGELYRFDINHPDTNGMIDYFVRPMSGIRSQVGRGDTEAFARKSEMKFRAKPAGVVEAKLGEGSLNLIADCQRAAAVAGGPFKFTVTSPYMLARTLHDKHYGSFAALTMAIARVLADQVRDLPCACLQVDEANIPGNPEDGPLAAMAINVVLDAFAGVEPSPLGRGQGEGSGIAGSSERVDKTKNDEPSPQPSPKGRGSQKQPLQKQTAVHLCFGNYGGQTIQRGTWKQLLAFLNALHTDHLVLELAHRPEDDLHALKDVDPRIAIGLGVIDIKVNHVETADEIARRIDVAQRVLGENRVKWVHPDCGFWMLKRSIADRKIAALVKGRDRFVGR